MLSHDQHSDNLDTRGRGYLDSVPLVLSTAAAQQRLGGPVRALENWQHVELPRTDGALLRVTGVPARHGPTGCEPVTGPVTGFVLSGDGLPIVYVSGDNAALEHASAVADRFGPVDVAILFAGAARTALLDGAYLTLTSTQAAQAAAALGARHVVPLHFEGWAHFSEGRDTLHAAFAAAGIGDRLRLPGLGDLTSRRCPAPSGGITGSGARRPFPHRCLGRSAGTRLQAGERMSFPACEHLDSG